MQTRAQTQATFASGNDNISNGCSNNCTSQPLVLLFLTLIMTTSATAMLSAAIMTDHWEHITWDMDILRKITNSSTQKLNWVLNDKVAILHRQNHTRIFLVPVHGGIWTLCIDLSPSDIYSLKRHKQFPLNRTPCSSYLEGSLESSRREEARNDWHHNEIQTSLQPHLRMQNLSISCSLVCLIILGSAALVGAFGICQKQISAILITGIMYLLAALFALFTLMIIHYKRQHGRPILESDFNNGLVDGIVALPGALKHAHYLLSARIIITSWSLDLGWGGVALCSIASGLWILLSKVLRYNPISAFAI